MDKETKTVSDNFADQYADTLIESSLSKHTKPKKSDPRHRSKQSSIREIVLSISIPLLVVAFLRLFIVGIYVVPSGSMENTLMIGDRIMTSKLDGKLTPLKRGDIIVFKDPGHWLTTQEDDVPGGGFLVKRLIGLPGDDVACCDASGDITVNGQPINETSYLKPGDPPSLIRFNVVVTPGNLFVLGDNRSNSADSRYHLNENDGLVPVSDVVGVVKLVYWPLDRVKWISRPASVFEKVGGISGVYE
ncbi:MAG: signal peptidase I [Aeriscardovia sp.]|nr:signal peptidase I [Aeriscardovia sp.]